MNRPNIIKAGALDLEVVRQLAVKPPLYKPGEPLFWNDPHISEQMLKAHLDPATDAASRKPETIDRTVEWLLSSVPIPAGASVIDLGCGPGLYCERLQRRGWRMTGMDFSRRSVDYARRRAAELRLPVEYAYQDYLTLDYDARFDAALMIYQDFGVLSNEDRAAFLGRVQRALRPGGHFVFDVSTRRLREQREERADWEVSAGGFWRPGPHMCLSQAWNYAGDDAILDQYIVVEPTGEAFVYRVWERYFSPATLEPLLNAHGFAVEAWWGDLTGVPYSEQSKLLAVMARKN